MTGRSRLVTLFILLCPVTLLLAWQYHARYPVLDHIYAARPGWRPCADLSAYSRGRWAPRIAAKATSVFDLGFKQNTSDALHKLECRPLNSKVSWAQFGTLTQDAEDLDIELRHVVDVHNYAFAPDRCPLRPFDPAAFVAYLLRSPRGMFLVGDSLAGQHLAGIQMLLGVLDTTSDAEALVVTKGNPATFFANAAHPGVHALRHSYSEADWADRLQHPVITFRWTSHLASNAMLVDALKEAGVPKSVGRSPERYPGYRDADWYGPIAEALRGDGPSVDGSTPTLLVLNSGPHWSTRHLDGLDGMEYDKAGPIIQQVYKAAVGICRALQHQADARSGAQHHLDFERNAGKRPASYRVPDKPASAGKLPPPSRARYRPSRRQPSIQLRERRRTHLVDRPKRIGRRTCSSPWILHGKTPARKSSTSRTWSDSVRTLAAIQATGTACTAASL
jgi:hypothetical protein